MEDSFTEGMGKLGTVNELCIGLVGKRESADSYPMIVEWWSGSILLGMG